MKNIRNYGFLALLWLTLSAVAFASPITVTVKNPTQDLNLNGGGEFNAKITPTNPAGSTFAVEMFCVDWQNYLIVDSVTQSYSAYLSDSTDISKTRYGNTTSFMTITVANDAADTTAINNLTSLQRYTMAAYLISQINVAAGATSTNIAYQEAIWALLSEAGATSTGYTTDKAQIQTDIISALAYKNSTTYLNELRIVTSTDTKSPVNTSNVNCFKTGEQEFMYLTPEPATYAMIGLGLIGLASLRRRRA